jgi:tetratricopeptide (TPR) repeat protein
VDWDWEMPAVTLAALFCGAAVLAASRGRVKTYVLSARFRIAGIAAAGVLGAWAFMGVIGNGALAASEDATNQADRQTQEANARKASRWAPWSSAPWRLLGEAQLARGELAPARESLRRAIDKDPGDWRLWYDLALASAGAAQRQALARALHLNPLEPELVQFRSELGGGAG